VNLKTSFKHIEPTDALKKHIEEKSLKLNKYFKGRINVSWNITFEKQTAVAHCHLVGNSMDYFGEADAPNFFAAVDVVVDKIERQVRKHKEQVRDHLHAGGIKGTTKKAA